MLLQSATTQLFKPPAHHTSSHLSIYKFYASASFPASFSSSRVHTTQLEYFTIDAPLSAVRTTMNIIVTIMEAVLLLSAGMVVILVLYFLVLLWFAARNHSELPQQEKSTADEGLSTADLENLPKFAGKDMAATAIECAVCLEEIGSEELARVVPVCNHGFHLECADTWLSKHPVCPLCRAQIKPKIHSPSENLR